MSLDGFLPIIFCLILVNPLTYLVMAMIGTHIFSIDVDDLMEVT